jgi:hypothetical protein
MGVVRVVGSRKCTWESGNGTNKISLRARGYVRTSDICYLPNISPKRDYAM